MIYKIFLGLSFFAVHTATSMEPHYYSRLAWLKEEVGKKWLCERIIPAGLIAFAGYRYITEGCIDERCKNLVEPLVIAGVLASHRPIKELINSYKASRTPQNSPRKVQNK